MEFSFDVNSLLPNTITRVTGRKFGKEQGITNHEWFSEVVEKMGQASAKAQGLRQPITTVQRLRLNEETLYIMKGCTESGKGIVRGMMKVGRKKLFLADCSGVQREVEPLCVLDFYVHESQQRSGHGKRLFEAMIQGEGVKPCEVAIDRPSAKFLSFLRKHYNLQSYINQANRFVVFNEFFDTCNVAKPKTRSSRSSIPQSSWTHSKIPALDFSSRASSSTNTTTTATPHHNPSPQVARGNQSVAKEKNVPTKSVEKDPSVLKKDSASDNNGATPTTGGDYNWTVTSLSSQNKSCPYKQERLTYKLRNLQGTGHLGFYESTSNHQYNNTGAVSNGNPAPYLNMRCRGPSQQPSRAAVLGPSFSSAQQHRTYGFSQSTGYTRHKGLFGAAGGGASLGNRVVLKGDSSFGKQDSTHAHYKPKDSWKQFIS